MSKTIIGVCVAVFVLQLAVPSLTNDLSFAPVVGWSEPWRLLTSAFLHSPGNLLHIGFNMFVLWQIGPYLESLLGRARFVALYLVSAIGGSVGYLLLASAPTAGVNPTLFFADHPAWVTGVVGASGAVFGLFGAMLVLDRHLGRSTAGIGLIIIANAVLGFVVPASPGRPTWAGSSPERRAPRSSPCSAHRAAPGWSGRPSGESSSSSPPSTSSSTAGCRRSTAER